MLLQPEQISVSQHDEVHPPGVGTLKNTAVCLVRQNATARFGRTISAMPPICPT